MPTKEIKKIIKVGNSLAVTINPSWLRYFNLKDGDKVTVVSDGSIVIQPMPKSSPSD